VCLRGSLPFVRFEFVLAGFKWLGNRAIELKASGVDVLFCYEEALGFCVGDVVHDKDGLSAAAVFTGEQCALSQCNMPCLYKQFLKCCFCIFVCLFDMLRIEMVVELVEANNGSADNVVQSRLQSLYDKYGEFVSYNSYVLSHDGKVTDAIFARLRTGGEGGGYWSACAGSKIVAIKDVTMGYDSTTAEGDDSGKLPTTPDSHMIMYEFENGCSVTLRTSGTEPKIKYYTEIAGAVGQARETIKAELHRFVDALVNEMLQPDVHGLQRA
jgi:phosphomannomutase